MDYKTQEDLDQVVKLGKSESVIRTFWIKTQLGNAFNLFVNGTEKLDKNGKKINPSLKDKYNTLYPVLPANTDLKLPTGYLEYNTTIDKDVFNIKTGVYEKITIKVFPEECYQTTADKTTTDKTTTDKTTTDKPIADKPIAMAEPILDENGNKILKVEYKDIPVRPTLELYKEQAIIEYHKTETQPALTDYVTFIKPIMLDMVNTQFEDSMSYVTSSYPMAEQQTWPTQKAEAYAYIANNKAPTPMLDTIAKTRGVDRVTLIKKTAAKSKTFDTLVATAIGYRQKAEDMINAVTTVDMLDTVIVDLTNSREIFKTLVDDSIK